MGQPLPKPPEIGPNQPESAVKSIDRDDSAYGAPGVFAATIMSPLL